MSNRKKWFILSLLLLLPLLAGGLFWGYFYYQSEAFQRAYRNGNTYDQLNSLMNTTRYAKAVRKAGYSVDDYGLKMNDRIDTLETKTEPVVRISVPTKGGIDTSIVLKENERLSLDFDPKMNLTSILHYRNGKYLLNNEFPKEDRDKYETFVRKAMVKTVKDIHDSMPFQRKNGEKINYGSIQDGKAISVTFEGDIMSFIGNTSVGLTLFSDLQIVGFTVEQV